VSHTVRLPRLGDTVEGVVVLEWLVPEGARVAADEPVLRVETAKVESEVVSPVTGVLVTHLVNEEDEVPTGAPLFVVDETA
jgi:pyruvate/2-oxoglutarate dehydrogenase complex dihydrolipoamide acyltransferase (E2) component